MYLSNKNKFRIYYLYYKDKSTNKIRKITTGTKLKKEAFEFIKNFNPEEIEKTKELKNYDFKDMQHKVLNYACENFTKSTNLIYKNAMNYFLKIVGNKPLNLITINDIEFFKAERLKKVNKVTVNIDLRTLKSIFSKGVVWGMLKENPCKYVKSYILNEKEKLCLEKSEIEKLLSIINNTDMKYIVEFALYTGCRISEILNIQLGDVDLVNKTITIRNKSNFKTKTGKIRQIPISNKLYILFEELGNYKNGCTDKIYKLRQPEEYLFTNQRGIKFDRTYVTMRFKKYLIDAGLDDKYHFHCLRHTFISNLIKKGVNINYVKELAGHSSISTTMNYIHIVTEDLRTAVNLI